MAIDFKTFTDIVPHVCAIHKPIMLRGKHGVGKSQVVYQIANELNLPVVERRASQMTEGDLVGLPSVDDESTRFNPPDWFKTACQERVLLFLDEVDRATIEVRQGIFELTDSRKLNGHTLHPDTLIFAAVNGGEHGDQYQVGEMDPAELDRWTVFDVEPSVEDWLSWAQERVDPVTWDFINQNRNHLEHEGEFEPNKVYPSRRSWERLDQCLVTANLICAGEKNAALFNLSTGFVGFEAAVALNDFIWKYSKQVSIEDLLEEGRIGLTKDFSINDHNAMVEKFEQSNVFDEAISENQIANLADYFVQLPSEVMMKLWTVIGSGDNANVIALHQASTSEGRKICDYLVEVMTGKTDSE